ncbi:hypothetical protein IFM89_004042 [Coptis chinensis]|uniref:Uncharacterized protein n=1 Tax=Coptis chinensis TaxID=261450 RepID=A0A835GV64_9MAGN|nr:hypothetical protein IFM89_004042 [Coptis chinensis]
MAHSSSNKASNPVCLSNSCFNIHYLLLTRIFAGGNVVLLYASQYRDVKVVVNLSGRFNLARGIEGRLGKDIMQRIENDGFIDVRDKTGNIPSYFLTFCMYMLDIVMAH